MIRILAISLALAGASASAQVYRCKLPSGQTSYSGKPCEDLKSGVILQERPSQAAIMREREAARDAEMRKMERKINTMEQAQAQQQARQYSQPVAQPQLQSGTKGCQTAQSELDNASRSVYRNNDDKRSAINAAIAKSNAACGSRTELMQEPAKIISAPAGPTTCVPTGRTMHCF